MCQICDGRTPEDMAAEIDSRIAEYGVTFVSVDHDDARVYSLGMTEKGLPELYLDSSSGLEGGLQEWQVFLNVVSERVRKRGELSESDRFGCERPDCDCGMEVRALPHQADAAQVARNRYGDDLRVWKLEVSGQSA